MGKERNFTSVDWGCQTCWPPFNKDIGLGLSLAIVLNSLYSTKWNDWLWQSKFQTHPCLIMHWISKWLLSISIYISIHLHVHRSLKPKFLKDVRWGIASMEYAEVHKRIQWLGALWMATIDDWCIQPGTSRGLWTLIIYFAGPLDMFTFYAEDAAIRTSVTPA